MIRYRLGAGAANVRWAMSPIHEVVSLAQLLTEPQRHPMFHPWLRRRRRRRLPLPDLGALTVFMAHGAYRPDFLDPSPMSSEPTFEEGMHALLAAPADQTYAELVDATMGRGAAMGRRLLEDPDRARSEAADTLRRLWKAVVEPEWPSMRQALRAEMLDRAIQVNRDGLRAVLPRLHPSAACEGDTITVEKTVDIDVDCPEGLILVPSLFITDRMQCTTSDHWTPAIYYPASGRYLWATPPTPRSLDRLLGVTRSRILAALATPLQTTVVARLVSVTPPDGQRTPGNPARRRVDRQQPGRSHGHARAHQGWTCSPGRGLAAVMTGRGAVGGQSSTASPGTRSSTRRSAPAYGSAPGSRRQSSWAPPRSP